MVHRIANRRACAHDWQCETYNCVEGVCGPQPLPGGLTCEDIKDNDFSKIRKSGCDDNDIISRAAGLGDDYTHCYRDECTDAHNRDYAIRQECACRNMYYDGKYHDCGDWYFAGLCVAYPTEPLDSLLEKEKQQPPAAQRRCCKRITEVNGIIHQKRVRAKKVRHPIFRSTIQTCAAFSNGRERHELYTKQVPRE